jgi:hypothetical protein
MGGSAAITQNLQGLGPYRLSGLLGFNGMFASFQGSDTQSMQNAILVAVHQSFIDDPKAWETHERDFAALAKEPVQQICHPIRHGQDAGHYWASYQWLEGAHLGIRIRDNGLPKPAEAFSWISEAAHGLAVMHRRRVRHLIINPASLFLENNGQIRLLHGAWGSMIRACPEGLLHPSFSCVLPFASPEIAGGAAGDEASDVYALGTNLFFLLTGYPPFWDDDPATLARQIIENPLPLETLRESLPRDAYDLIDEMTQKNPEDRPVNTPALADRLAAAARSVDRAQASARVAEEERARAAAALQAAAEAKAAAEAAAAAAAAVGNAASPQLSVGSSPLQSPGSAGAPLPRPRPGLPLEDPVAASRQKRTKLLILGIGGGILLVAVLLAALLGISMMSKAKKAAAERVAQATGTDSAQGRKQVDASYDRYMEAAAKLRVLGQYSRGYTRSNGDWPDKIEQLVSVGAKSTEFLDPWQHGVEARPGGFIVSCGADGKWDTDDDIWYDTEKSAIGGFMPPAPAVGPRKSMK